MGARPPHTPPSLLGLPNAPRGPAVSGPCCPCRPTQAAEQAALGPPWPPHAAASPAPSRPWRSASVTARRPGSEALRALGRRVRGPRGGGRRRLGPGAHLRLWSDRPAALGCRKVRSWELPRAEPGGTVADPRQRGPAVSRGVDARPRGLRRVRCLGGPSPSFHVCLVLLSHDLASVAPAPSHAPRLRPVRRNLGLHPTLPPGASARPRCSPARGAHRASSGLPSPRAQKGERLSGEQVAAVAVAARGWARAPPPGPSPLPGHCGLRPCIWPAHWKAAGLAATTPTLHTAPAAGQQVKLRERVT